MPGMLQPTREIEWGDDDISRKVTVYSLISGKPATLPILMRREDYNRWISGEAYIQDALAYLLPSEREFLLSGIMPEIWDAMFADPPSEGDDADADE